MPIKSISAANDIVDKMAFRRLRTNPEEKWNRDIPLAVQRQLFPEAKGIAYESDKGRGAIALDLMGEVSICGGMMTMPVYISVKSTRGKGRKHGRTAIYSTGTLAHIRAIWSALISGHHAFPTQFVHLNTANGQWVQTFFDAGHVAREVLRLRGAGDTGIGCLEWACGKRGVPMTLRETTRPGTENVYYSINFNMAPLVTPEGQRVSRCPGVVGLGLAEPWREVSEPEIQWEYNKR